jgi:uncharacterized phage protein gp47/JayE
MPITEISLYRSRADILADMLAQLIAAIPDAHTGDDGVLYITFEIEAGQLENLYLANQLLLEDSFITTASFTALQRHGEVYALPMKIGTKSIGNLLFTGSGATFIPAGTEVAYDPGGGIDPMYFITTGSGTIPDPGTPAAPTVALNATAGNLNGLYEYVVTYVTVSGETLPSAISGSVSPVNQQANLSVIPIGGAGTTQRKIYRRKNGTGDFRLVTTIANNTGTTYTDNITDATVAGNPLAPTVDTAHSITITAESDDVGVEKNVGIGTITVLSNAPASLTAVTNVAAFAGASDPEDTEDYRQRLLAAIQNPQTGSPADLKSIAESITGVEIATVFQNTPTAGTSTVRIVGPGGVIPSAGVQADVLAALTAVGYANLGIVVDVFTAVATNVTVDVTTSGTYTLADVTPSVVAAISDYINDLGVGETLYVAGIIDAVFGLAGIADVVMTTPTTNQTTTSTQKRTPGTITVT